MSLSVAAVAVDLWHKLGPAPMSAGSPFHNRDNQGDDGLEMLVVRDLADHHGDSEGGIPGTRGGGDASF